MNLNNDNNKNKNLKTAKGYRLKVSTHEKIKELQSLTNTSQDLVISRAIRAYIRELNSKIINNK